MDPHIKSALERNASAAWGERYRLARRIGFSDGDARLHAAQAAALVRAAGTSTGDDK